MLTSVVKSPGIRLVFSMAEAVPRIDLCMRSQRVYERPSRWSTGSKSGVGGHAALESQEDEVSAAANAEFVEQIRNVKFDGALGNVELAGDFFIGEIFKKRVEDFLFAAAEIGYRIGFEPARLAGKDRIHEAGKNSARHPETATGNERKSTNELIACFGISEDAFHAQAQQRKAVGVLMSFSDHDKAGVRMAFKNVGEECAGSLASGVSVDHVNLGFWWFEGTEIGSKRGLKLLADDLEVGLGQNAFELAQHQRMWREQADRQFW
jgi:hypothetical protein